VKIFKKFKKRKKQYSDVNHTILDDDIMAKYEYNEDKLQVWIDEGITHDVMHEFSVKYDTFSDRIVYPIRGLHGEIISVKGRTLDPLYKEKKLRKYTYFQSVGELDTLFGYYENIAYIIDQREVIVFEGEKSVMICKALGINNTCAILTSHMNHHQLRILIQLGVRVVFALDKEIDVTKDDNIQKLIRFVKVEAIQDPDNLLDEKMSPIDKGLDVWNKLYAVRRSLN
jgi:DNA primase